MSFGSPGGVGPDPTADTPRTYFWTSQLFAISDAECSTHFSFFRRKEEVCAFGEEVAPERYNDSCYGDSGGPLIADALRGALLVGIVSYGGIRCGVKHPGVYTQVADNLGFIERKAGLR